MIWKNHAPFVAEFGSWRLPDILDLSNDRKGIAVGPVNQYRTIVQILRVAMRRGTFLPQPWLIFPQANCYQFHG
jgi:hypothetical protein